MKTTAAAAVSPRRVHKARRVVPERWVAIDGVAPQLAETMLAYLDQVTVSLRPATVSATETDLWIFAGFLIEHDSTIESVAEISRSHIEAFKLWQHAQPGNKGHDQTGNVPAAARVATHVLPSDY
jgi:hypothetical protein